MSDKNLWVALAALFLLWLVALSLGGTGSSLDRIVLDALHGGDLVGPARLVTWFGNWPATTAISLVAATAIAAGGDRRRALLFLLITISGRLLVEAQKYLFARARPDAEGHLVAVHSLSFPSGHAASSMLICLGLALLAAPARWRVPAILLAVFVSLTIGLTRLVLDVHWPSDLVGGWSFGAAWTLLLVRLGNVSAPPALMTGRRAT